MMLYLVFAILGLATLVPLGVYAFRLLKRLKAQQEMLSQARLARTKRLKESMEIIAKAMQNGDCDLSEGVLRQAMLLQPFGKSLAPYPAMAELYDVVKEMPTHEAYQALEKKARMQLDLTRAKAESRLADEIMLELPRFLGDIVKFGEI